MYFYSRQEVASPTALGALGAPRRLQPADQAGRESLSCLCRRRSPRLRRRRRARLRGRRRPGAPLGRGLMSLLRHRHGLGL